MYSSSMHLCNAIKDACGQYQDGKEANPGLVPVFACTGTAPQRTSSVPTTVQ